MQTKTKFLPSTSVILSLVRVLDSHHSHVPTTLKENRTKEIVADLIVVLVTLFYLGSVFKQLYKNVHAKPACSVITSLMARKILRLNRNWFIGFLAEKSYSTLTQTNNVNHAQAVMTQINKYGLLRSVSMT